jgi:NurA domain.
MSRAAFSRDILSMLDHFSGGQGEGQTKLFDGPLIYDRLDTWGSRTCFCYSKRRGLNAFHDEATGRSTVGFTYLHAASASPPARIDIPAWIYEDGLLDEIIDIVRAECVIGLGYPYALETADQTALISSVDRDIFLRALQELAAREKLGFSVSRKAASKARRR